MQKITVSFFFFIFQPLFILIKKEHKGSDTHDIQFIYALQKMNVLQSLKAKLDKPSKFYSKRKKKKHGNLEVVVRY